MSSADSDHPQPPAPVVLPALFPLQHPSVGMESHLQALRFVAQFVVTPVHQSYVLPSYPQILRYFQAVHQSDFDPSHQDARVP